MDEYLRAAGSGEGEELWAALRTQRSRVFERALGNRNLTEDMAHFIAKSKNSTAEVLGVLASDVRFNRSYKMMLALVRNALTPIRISNSLLKHIKIFDLADLTRNHFVHSVTRQKVEVMLMERIPSLPSGVKSALSRRASARIIIRIMERSDRRVIVTCLDSSRVTEDLLVKVLQKRATKPMLVRAIAEHKNWSLRYRVRYALIRNFNTPLALLEGIIPEMKTTDLREMYADPEVPDSVKPLIHSALLTRDKDVAIPEDVVYDIPEDADDLLSEDGDIAGIIKGEEEGKALDEDDPDDPDSDDWELGCARSEPDETEEDDWELG
jgi:hypothetical protein